MIGKKKATRIIVRINVPNMNEFYMSGSYLFYQIAETFRDAGVTSRFHEGAAEIFSLLGSTPFAEETRETLDMNRGLSEAVKIYVQSLNKR